MMSDGYNATLIRGFYNFYDFGDPPVQRSTGMFLDLYFALLGAKSRLVGIWAAAGHAERGRKRSTRTGITGNAPLAWFYFAIGKQPTVNGHDVNAALSAYRPPTVVADIAS